MNTHRPLLWTHQSPATPQAIKAKRSKPWEQGLRQTRRIEYKYLLHPAAAAAISDELERTMSHDKNSHDYDNCAYPVYSIYFDTHTGFDANFEKQEGLPIRNKIRIRTYCARYSPHVPIFLEYKTKHNDIHHKFRRPITFDQYQRLLTTPQTLLHDATSTFIRDMAHEMTRKQLVPRVRIFYTRKAFIMSDWPEFRVNLDYQLHNEASVSPNIETKFAAGTIASANFPWVVFEIKFWRCIPTPLQSIIRRYRLHRVAFSKYCQSVARMIG